MGISSLIKWSKLYPARKRGVRRQRTRILISICVLYRRNLSHGFYANEGKAVTIQANGKTYARHAITTHFVQVGENYIDLLEEICHTSLPTGRDILSASEKSLPYAKGG